MEIFYLVGGAIIGLVLSITPIPYLPIMFVNGARDCWEKDRSIGDLLFFFVCNILWALLPLMMILGAFTENFLGGLAFSIAMYFPLWWLKDDEHKGFDNKSQSDE